MYIIHCYLSFDLGYHCNYAGKYTSKFWCFEPKSHIYHFSPEMLGSLKLSDKSERIAQHSFMIRRKKGGKQQFAYSFARN